MRRVGKNDIEDILMIIDDTYYFDDEICTKYNYSTGRQFATDSHEICRDLMLEFDYCGNAHKMLIFLDPDGGIEIHFNGKMIFQKSHWSYIKTSGCKIVFDETHFSILIGKGLVVCFYNDLLSKRVEIWLPIYPKGKYNKNEYFQTHKNDFYESPEQINGWVTIPPKERSQK
jgi:hypothetical protein